MNRSVFSSRFYGLSWCGAIVIGAVVGVITNYLIYSCGVASFSVIAQFGVVLSSVLSVIMRFVWFSIRRYLYLNVFLAVGIQALCEAEDDEDVKAAAVASEEAGAELAEFDENIPWDEREAEFHQQQQQTSKVRPLHCQWLFRLCYNYTG